MDTGGTAGKILRIVGMDADGYIKKISALRRQFDDDFVRRLIQSIKIIKKNKIEIQFKSGIVIKQDFLCDA